MMAVFAGRLLQTRAEVSRIRTDGFSSDDISRGLLAVLAERAARRAQLRANPVVLEARRRTARAAGIMIVAAVALTVIGFRSRYIIDGRVFTPAYGIALVLSSMIMMGLGMVLLLRNPLKAPAEDRFLRSVWLGPIGRAFFGFDQPLARGTVNATTNTARSPVATPTNVNARLDALEARVTTLEKR
jgi:hypothetical protein